MAAKARMTENTTTLNTLRTAVPLRVQVGHALKRAFDLLGALIGLILLAPVFGVIALLIKKDSPGPVFYHGRRAAYRGGEFRILKFRTMYENGASYAGPKVTAGDDPRITQLGHFLRDTKINELPQLWNVLKGEMSLVGPRPEDPDIVATWPEAVQREILSVRPGVTSPASVLYRDEESLLKSNEVMDTYLTAILPSKMRLDQLYVRHRSLLLDLDVILWTLLVLVPRLGGYQPGESRLFWGPVSLFVRRYFNWFVIDGLISLGAIAVTGVFWRSFEPLNVGWPKAIVVAIGFALLFSFVGSLMGVQRIVWTQANTADAFELILPTMVATITALVINQLTFMLVNDPLFPPMLIVMASVIALAGFVAVRYRRKLAETFLQRVARVRPGAQAALERVLIIGGGSAGHFAAWLLGHNHRNPGVQVVGYIDDDLYKQGERIQGVRVLGRRDEIPELVERYDIGVIVFAIHHISARERLKFLEICAKTPAQVIMFPDFLGALNASIAMQAGQARNTEVTTPLIMAAPGIAPGQVDYWLAGLEKLAEQGETELLREQLSGLRRQLQMREAHENHPAAPGD